MPRYRRGSDDPVAPNPLFTAVAYIRANFAVSRNPFETGVSVARLVQLDHADLVSGLQIVISAIGEDPVTYIWSTIPAVIQLPPNTNIYFGRYLNSFGVGLNEQQS